MKQHLARALCWACDAGDKEGCDCVCPQECDAFDIWEEMATPPSKVIEALHAQGFTIVPLSPTDEMIEAAYYAEHGTNADYPSAAEIYKAMLKANLDPKP